MVIVSLICKIANDSEFNNIFRLNDNDFYLVIGQIDHLELFNDLELMEFKDEVIKIERRIRDKLALNPQNVVVTTDDLFFVQYQKETLELSTSKAWSIKKSKNNANFIDSLY